MLVGKPNSVRINKQLNVNVHVHVADLDVEIFSSLLTTV